MDAYSLASPHAESADEAPGVPCAECPRCGALRLSPCPCPHKVLCISISMYTEDLARLDGMVDALKARGLTKASRSALIRLAHHTAPARRLPLLLAAAGALETERGRSPRLDDLRTWLRALGAEGGRT